MTSLTSHPARSYLSLSSPFRTSPFGCSCLSSLSSLPPLFRFCNSSPLTPSTFLSASSHHSGSSDTSSPMGSMPQSLSLALFSPSILKPIKNAILAFWLIRAKV